MGFMPECLKFVVIEYSSLIQLSVMSACLPIESMLLKELSLCFFGGAGIQEVTSIVRGVVIYCIHLCSLPFPNRRRNVYNSLNNFHVF